MKLRQYIDELAQRFEAAGLHYGHGTDNAADEAVYLVFAGLDLDFNMSPEQWAERIVQPAEHERLEALARQRIEQRIPVAYLVGQAWFAGMAFHSDERALVPRSPIAELIDGGFEPLLAGAPSRILDLCAGGGCIGIACAAAFPSAQVELAELSADALKLARANVRRHGLEERVQLRHGDLFDAVEGFYDLIVANPPYVSEQEWQELPTEYGREPAMGLLAEDNGLSIPLTILARAADHLNDGGVLILEVGHSWQLLQQRLADVPLLWLEFEHGGEGVLAMTREQLLACAPALHAAASAEA